MRLCWFAEFEVGESSTKSDSDEDTEIMENMEEGGAEHQSSQSIERQQPTTINERPRRNVRLPAKFYDYDMSFFALCVAEVLLYV